MTKACIICGTNTGSNNARCPQHALRSRPRGNAFEPTRQHILARDNWECQIRLDGCTADATHVDHIIPLSAGGTNTDTNLQAACAHCNLRKAAT